MDVAAARSALLHVARLGKDMNLAPTTATASSEHCNECLLTLACYRVWSSTDSPLERSDLRATVQQASGVIKQRVLDQAKQTGDAFLVLAADNKGTATVALTLHQTQAIAALRAASLILGDAELAVLAATMMRGLHRFYSSPTAGAGTSTAASRFDGNGAFHLGLKLDEGPGAGGIKWKPLRALTTDQALLLLYLEPGDLPKHIVGKIAASSLSLETPIGLKTGKTLKPVAPDAAKLTARKKAVVSGDTKWSSEGEIASVQPVYFISPLEQAAVLLGAAKHMRRELASLVERRDAAEKAEQLEDLIGGGAVAGEDAPPIPNPMPIPSDTEDASEGNLETEVAAPSGDAKSSSLLDETAGLDRRVAAELLALAEQASIKQHKQEGQAENVEGDADAGANADSGVDERDLVVGFEGLADDEDERRQAEEASAPSSPQDSGKPSLSFSLLHHLVEASLRVNIALERLEREASHRVWGRKLATGIAPAATARTGAAAGKGSRQLTEGELAHSFTFPSLLAVLHSGPVAVAIKAVGAGATGEGAPKVNSVGLALLKKKKKGAFYASKAAASCPCWSLDPVAVHSSLTAPACQGADGSLPVLEVSSRLHTPLAYAAALYDVDGTGLPSGGAADVRAEAEDVSSLPSADGTSTTRDLLSNVTVLSAVTLQGSLAGPSPSKRVPTGTERLKLKMLGKEDKLRAPTVGAPAAPANAAFLAYSPHALVWRPTAFLRPCMAEEQLVLDIPLTASHVKDGGSEHDDEDDGSDVEHEEVAAAATPLDAASLAKKRSREKLAEAAGIVVRAAKKGLKRAVKAAQKGLRRVKPDTRPLHEDDEDDKQQEHDDDDDDFDENDPALTVPRVILRGYGRPFDVGTASASKFFKRLFVAGKSTAFRRWEEELAEKALVAENPEQKEALAHQQNSKATAALMSSFVNQVRSLGLRHGSSAAQAADGLLASLDEEARMGRYIMASSTIPRVADLVHPLLMPAGEAGAISNGLSAENSPASFVRQFCWIDDSERLSAAKALERGEEKQEHGQASADEAIGDDEGDAAQELEMEAQSRPIEGVDAPVEDESGGETGNRDELEAAPHGTVDPSPADQDDNAGMITAAPILPGSDEEAEKADNAKRPRATKAVQPKPAQPVSVAASASRILAVDLPKLYSRVCGDDNAISRGGAAAAAKPWWHEQCCAPGKITGLQVMMATMEAKQKQQPDISTVVALSSLPTFTCPSTAALAENGGNANPAARTLPCAFILDGYCDCNKGLDEPQSRKALCPSSGLFRCHKQGAFMVAEGDLQPAPKELGPADRAQLLLPWSYLASDVPFEKLLSLAPAERASLGFIDASKVKDGVKDCVGGEDEEDEEDAAAPELLALPNTDVVAPSAADDKEAAQEEEAAEGEEINEDI